MKNLTLLLLVLPLCGCGGEFVSGAAVGAGIASGGSAYLNSVLADLEEREAVVIAQRQKAIEKMESTTDSLEKAVLENEIKTLQTRIVDIQTQKEAVNLAQKGLDLNWADPEAVGGWAGTVFSLALAWFLKRKCDMTSKKYGALKAGVNSFLAASDKESSMKLYETVGREQIKAGVKSP